MLVAHGVLTGTPKLFQVPVDPSVGHVLFSISGEPDAAPAVVITRPDGTVVGPGSPGVTLQSLSTGTLVGVASPTAGLWTLSVTGTSEYSVTVQGNTSLSVEDFRFVEHVDSVHAGFFDIDGQPVAGQPATALARVGGTTGPVTFEAVGLDGVALAELPLVTGHPHAADGDYTGNVDLPGSPFRVRARGTYNGFAFQRVLPKVFRGQAVRVSVDSTTVPESVPSDTEATVRFSVFNGGPAAIINAVAHDDLPDLTYVQPSWTLSLAAGETRVIDVPVRVPPNTAKRNAHVTVSATVQDQPDLGNEASADLTVGEAPTNPVAISDFSPKTGPVGTSVTISGTSFGQTAAENAVTFNGSPAVVTEATTTALVVTVPAGVTTGPVTVLSPQGSATSAESFVFDGSGDVTALITPGGPPVSITTSVGGQNARLTFSGVAGRRIALGLTDVTIAGSSCCSALVSITNPDGSVLTGPTYFGTLGAFIDTLTLGVTGTYTIIIDPTGSNTGSVTLQLYDVPPDALSSIVPGGSPVSIGPTAVGQNARLSFSGVPGQRVSLKLTNVTIAGSSCCSAFVSIINPSGNVLAGPTYFGTAGGFIDTRTLSVAGTYVILINPAGSNTGGVTVQLYDAPGDAVASIVPGGPPVSIGTTGVGQNARLSFSGTPGQRVSLQLTNVTIAGSSCCSAFVSIINPDGSILAGATYFGTSGAFVDTLALGLPGTYTILLDPTGTNTGDVTVRLYEVPDDEVSTVGVGDPAVPISIVTPGQNAAVAFVGAGSQQVTVRISGNTIGWVTVKLLRPDGSTLTSTFQSAAAFNLPVQTLAVSGTYKISIDASGIGTGVVSLSITSP